MFVFILPLKFSLLTLTFHCFFSQPLICKVTDQFIQIIVKLVVRNETFILQSWIRLKCWYVPLPFYLKYLEPINWRISVMQGCFIFNIPVICPMAPRSSILIAKAMIILFRQEDRNLMNFPLKFSLSCLVEGTNHVDFLTSNALDCIILRFCSTVKKWTERGTWKLIIVFTCRCFLLKYKLIRKMSFHFFPKEVSYVKWIGRYFYK